MKFKKVLITGADGLLGSNLVRALLKANYQVSVYLMTGTKSGTLNGLNITRIYGDILESEGISKAAKGQDVIIHAAANTSVWPPRSKVVTEVNLKGTQNVVNAAVKHRIKRLIHVGTANSFEKGTPYKPGNECSSFGEDSYGLDYIESKRRAQEYVLSMVKEKQLPAVIVNPTFMIGPYDSKPSSGDLILSLYKRKIPIIPGGSKNYIAVKDAVIAIMNSIEMGEVGECYILANHNYTYKEAFEIMSKEVGVKAPALRVPSVLVKWYGGVNTFLANIFRFKPKVTKELATISCEHHCYSGEKARKKLKMPVTPLKVAVRESFIWLKSNGYV